MRRYDQAYSRRDENTSGRGPALADRGRESRRREIRWGREGGGQRARAQARAFILGGGIRPTPKARAWARARARWGRNTAFPLRYGRLQALPRPMLPLLLLLMLASAVALPGSATGKQQDSHAESRSDVPHRSEDPGSQSVAPSGSPCPTRLHGE